MSSYSETREDKDNWFGNDWQKWHDSTAVQDYLVGEMDLILQKGQLQDGLLLKVDILRKLITW